MPNPGISSRFSSDIDVTVSKVRISAFHRQLNTLGERFRSPSDAGIAGSSAFSASLAVGSSSAGWTGKIRDLRNSKGLHTKVLIDSIKESSISANGGWHRSKLSSGEVIALTKHLNR